MGYQATPNNLNIMQDRRFSNILKEQPTSTTMKAVLIYRSRPRKASNRLPKSRPSYFLPNCLSATSSWGCKTSKSSAPKARSTRNLRGSTNPSESTSTMAKSTTSSALSRETTRIPSTSRGLLLPSSRYKKLQYNSA